MLIIRDQIMDKVVDMLDVLYSDPIDMWRQVLLETLKNQPEVVLAAYRKVTTEQVSWNSILT